MNSENIKMAKKAKEIQDLWEPNKGDCVIVDGDYEIYLSKCERPKGNVVYRDFNGNDINTFIVKYWLPKQKDIQNIISKFLNKELNALYIQWKFVLKRVGTIETEEWEPIP